MGGFNYDRDDYYSSSTSGWNSKSADPHTSAGYSSFADKSFSSSLQPGLRADKKLKATKKLSIIFALDVTGSNTDHSKIVFDKMPMFWGQCEQKVMGGKSDDFELCYIGFGDAKTDNAPLQVTSFEQGIKCDDALSSLYLEGCGGGNDGESSELVGLYALNNIEISPDTTPILFIMTDEKTHGPALKSEAAMQGMDISEDIKDVWTPLRKKFKNNVFCLLGKYSGVNFDDSTTEHWKKLLGDNNVVLCGEPKALVDIMLGIINMVMQTMDLEEYKLDMLNRGQTNQRIESVTKSLKDLSTALSVINVKTDVTAATTPGKKAKNKVTRL